MPIRPINSHRVIRPSFGSRTLASVPINRVVPCKGFSPQYCVSRFSRDKKHPANSHRARGFSPATSSFVPCPGIPCPPFPRLRPVQGRLRPSHQVLSSVREFSPAPLPSVRRGFPAPSNPIRPIPPKSPIRPIKSPVSFVLRSAPRRLRPPIKRVVPCKGFSPQYCVSRFSRDKKHPANSHRARGFSPASSPLRPLSGHSMPAMPLRPSFGSRTLASAHKAGCPVQGLQPAILCVAIQSRKKATSISLTPSPLQKIFKKIFIRLVTFAYFCD